MDAKKEHVCGVIAKAMDLLHAHGLIERYEIDSGTDIRLCLIVAGKDCCFELQFFTGLGSSTDLASVTLVGRAVSATEYLKLSRPSADEMENLTVIRNTTVEDLICRQQEILLNPLVLAGKIAEAILNLL